NHIEVTTAPDLQASKPLLTEEQIAIINSTGNITINAVAGSGKTTTIIEYAATRPKSSKILYLAFNKSVKLEAARRFQARGLHNVKTETAHSLAYKYIVPDRGYKIKAAGYKTHEIADLLELQGNGEKHTEYVIANHINKFITYFCNSDKRKVQDLNYLDIVPDKKAKTFARSFYKYIEDGTRLLLAKMDKGEIEITHDFYLKKFQLSNPLLNYDYILFDEGQDASAAMLDVFMNQQAIKVIVGDVHQQIYAWRHAVNSLTKTDFKTLHLSTSFRFPQDIAGLAMGILQWKNHLYNCPDVVISGKGTSANETSKATIARTNLGLLLNAIEYITENRKVKRIYFEGNINSYTYADDGASLYDVLNLYNNSRDGIRDKLVKSMKDLDELEEYIEKTDDVQLSMMVEIVREYGNEIYGIIKSLKDLHTGDEERDKAEMIFSTVHRAKGMEYDVVYLVNDFITEATLEKLKAAQKDKEDPLNIQKLNEEINLLYVAVTRTKNQLYIPETLVPADFVSSLHVPVIKAKKDDAKPLPGSKKQGTQFKEKAYTVSEKRELHKDAYQPWTPALDRELKEMSDNGDSIRKMAERFGRTKGAIHSRLKKLDAFPD
ncbi:MAG TPA: UvrD-helicase domain-containing protein, partial [Mucilaginibacter sp.]